MAHFDVNPYLVPCPRCKAPELHPCVTPTHHGGVESRKGVCPARFAEVRRQWAALNNEAEKRERIIKRERDMAERLEIRRRVRAGEM